MRWWACKGFVFLGRPADTGGSFPINQSHESCLHVTSDMCGTCKRHEHGRALTSRLKIAWFINSLMWKIISKSHAMRVDKSWQTMLSYFIMNNRRLCCLFAKLIIPYFGPITASSKCALRHLSRFFFFVTENSKKNFTWSIFGSREDVWEVSGRFKSSNQGRFQLSPWERKAKKPRMWKKWMSKFVIVKYRTVAGDGLFVWPGL